MRQKAAPIVRCSIWSDAFDVVVVGGGSAGIDVTASLLRKRSSLRIAIVEPNDKHYYQPAWALAPCVGPSRGYS
ncbi:hypothetical protein EBAPG3_011585 [Nitrosospira lacus]|uniref:FAD/NAD(P)-binding domain-containing protein n=1 Tax=Nitrosospira lacus TaxID=1288494 RepID=A0A1W6SRC7_9PROT|nr:hypothetical protein EBAPG3_011585 [Nitrosospira lacus]